MDGLLLVAATNACTAAVLALAAAAVSRFIERPVLVHALWLVVLLELLSPPVFRIGVLPRTVLAGAVPRQAAQPSFSIEVLARPEPAGDALAGAWPRTTTLLGVGWLAGASIVLLLAGLRLLRFERTVAGARRAGPVLEAAVAAMATRLGLRHPPPMRLVPGRISPMLRPTLRGGVEILFPEALLDRLGDVERDALIAHELAHVARRDHWVRFVELAAAALFWWHPVLWWARARLRRAEERCCDAKVMIALPGQTRAYARGLLSTVEFLSGGGEPVPVLHSGAGGSRYLLERLTMIVHRRPSPSLPRAWRVALAIGALSLVLVFPTQADRAPGGGEPAAPAEKSLEDLQREVRELEHQIEQLHSHHDELSAELERRIAPTGRFRAAEQRAIEREAARRYDAARALADRARQLEREREIAERSVPGEAAPAAELEREAAQRERELAHLARERDAAARAEAEVHAAVRDAIHAEIAQSTREGGPEDIQDLRRLIHSVSEERSVLGDVERRLAELEQVLEQLREERGAR